MPVYIFSADDSEQTEIVMSARQDIPKTVRKYGKVFKRDIAAEHGGFQDTPGNWPQLSESAGCMPNQRKEFEARMSALGCPTQFPGGKRVAYAIGKLRS